MANKLMSSVERDLRLKGATEFVQKLCDSAGSQPSIATGYLRDILDALQGGSELCAILDKPVKQRLGEIDLTPKRLAHAETVIEQQNNLIISLRAELTESYAIDTKHQGEAVAARVAAYTPGMGLVELRVSGGIPPWLELGETVTVIAGEVQHHAKPVAVLIPFAEKVISKLRRFEECAGDSQDVDIGREWFDVLTHLGLLERVQRSPAYWEITQQGEDALDVARLNTPQ